MVARQSTVGGDLLRRHRPVTEDDIFPHGRDRPVVKPDRGDQRDAHETAVWALPGPFQPVVSYLGPADLDNYCLSGGLI